ncbi:ArsR/SmtB family transcription factor [Candidatus Thalassolituus haligoni]|uniref:ArsR/SmtB family transcription factor n=1 Tax=Candidatus Thalassolituus haligoni TaxID=3100113 RepID=UPI0035198FD8
MSLSSFDTQRQPAVRLLKALANEHRLAILCLLRSGEISVTELGRQLPLSQSALSQHLAWLRGEHLVASRREAQCVFYCLVDDKAVRVIRLLNELYGDDTPHV